MKGVLGLIEGLNGVIFNLMSSKSETSFFQAPRECYSLSRLTGLQSRPKNYYVGGFFQSLNLKKIQLSSQGVHCYWELHESLFDSASSLKQGQCVGLYVQGEAVTEILDFGAPEEDLQILNPKYNIENIEKWNLFLTHLREFFQKEHFLEVSTPSLLVASSSEPYLDFFKTQIIEGDKVQDRYLPTSPELSLKKMLSSGFTDIFEIKKCYRNNERGSHHSLEFWMLEFYRGFSRLDQLIQDFENLFQFLYEKKWLKTPFEKIHVYKMSELFQKFLNFDLTPKTPKEGLFTLAKKKGLIVSESHSWDDLFFQLFLEFIEPQVINQPEPIIVYEYPPTQAALARVNSNGWAERFELYYGGGELANAYDELTDPHEQVRRIEKDNLLRKKLSKEIVPLDKDFIRALKKGMPPSAGVAVGLERLFMAINGIKEINDLKPF